MLFPRKIKKIKDYLFFLRLNKISKKEILKAPNSKLSFGTAGVREKIASGADKINIYTIRRLTMAYVRFLKLNNKKPIKIILTHDNRLGSELFTSEVSKILSKNKIYSYLYMKPIPTPFNSAMIQKYKADGGIILPQVIIPNDYHE